MKKRIILTIFFVWGIIWITKKITNKPQRDEYWVEEASLISKEPWDYLSKSEPMASHD